MIVIRNSRTESLPLKISNQSVLLVIIDLYLRASRLCTKHHKRNRPFLGYGPSAAGLNSWTEAPVEHFSSNLDFSFEDWC